ncbi:hypothetical protein ACWC5C_25845 [Streptomyces sp. NPDC001700]
MQRFVRGDRLAGIVAAQVDVQLPVGEPALGVVRPAQREGCLARPGGTGDDADGDEERGVGLVAREDRVKAFERVGAVDEVPYVPGELTGRDGFCRWGGGMEVDAAADVAGLYDVVCCAGQLRVRAGILFPVSSAVDGLLPA